MPDSEFTQTECQSLHRALLQWYDRNARVLPWRVGPAARKAGKRPDPYRVWLSEIMLQQTTVATVSPRYQLFLDRWPSVAAMAEAQEADILEEWAGLGYYARARNLHKCAKAIVADHAGQFPKYADDLVKLPGIGPYTAAAISAIAFDQPAVVVDGNIERITARLGAIETALPAAKPLIKNLASEIWPARRPGDFAQALMDVGATICTPAKPKCGVCPISKPCRGVTLGKAALLPKKIKKPAKPIRYGIAYTAFNDSGKIWLVRRPDKGLLAGTLGLPGTDWSTRKVTVPFSTDTTYSCQVRHTFTHFHLMLNVVDVSAEKKINDYTGIGTVDGEWVDPESIRVPTIMRKAIDAALDSRNTKSKILPAI